MRILKLEFENLNSLKGHWEIDFTHPDYKKNHDIFVIHGTTGAGKTTILDAITLALYGRTPRQAAINNGEGGNELMTRGTGVCFSKVTYQCRNGIFASEFLQNRANGKASGKLQKASFRITKLADIRDETGEVVASGTASNLCVETQKLISLDYNQFCRSIMLAQGEFNKFLTSEERERANILEKLTGTEKYREIAQKICQKFSSIKRDFNDKKSAREEILSQLLSDEEEKSTLDSETEIQKKINENDKKMDRIRKELAFFDEFDRLFHEFEAAQKEKDAVNTEILNFKDEEKKLKSAQAAKNCETEFITLENLRTAQKNDENRIDDLSELIENAAKNYEKALKNAEELKKQLEDNEKLLVNQQAVWKKVRELDVQIQNAKEKKAEAEERKDSENTQIKDSEQKIENLTNQITGFEEAVKTSCDYLARNKDDEKLQVVIARVEALGTAAGNQNKTVQELQEKKSALLSKVDEVQQALNTEKKNLENVEEELRKFMADGAVEIARLLRGTLSEGKPCPVCGNVYHKKELSGQLEFDFENETDGKNEVNKDSGQIAETAASLSERHDVISMQVQKLTNELNSLESDLRNVTENLQSADSLLKNQISEIDDVISLWKAGILQNDEEFTLPKFDLVLEKLREKSSEWTKISSSLKDSENKKAVVIAELKTIKASLENRREAFKKVEAEYQSAASDLEKLIEDRKSLFGEKNPDEAETALTQKITQQKDDNEKAVRTQANASEEKSRLEAQRTQLQNAVEERTPFLKASLDDFSKKCTANGFENEDAFITARMSDSEFASLTSKSEELKTRSTKAETTFKNAQKSYEDYKSSAEISRSKEEVLNEQKIFLKEKDEFGNQLIEIKTKLQTNEQNKKRAQKIQEEFEELRSEFETWEQMKKWVGKDDGSDLSVFVQSLAFNRLLDITNKNLFDITHRYKIVQKAPLSLDFEINDIYFPENRSIKTLSGGEQFLVSLSLALGISRFASRNVSVDSLFLDEGFGTLSGELLEEVISALKNLQRENKMLGIITHVQEVINEIDQRIEVKPTSGGYSTLIGSGISKY